MGEGAVGGGWWLVVVDGAKKSEHTPYYIESVKIVNTTRGVPRNRHQANMETATPLVPRFENCFHCIRGGV